MTVVLPRRPVRVRSTMRVFRRVPQVRAYLPADLYREVKARHINASGLLIEALREEVLRQQRIEGIDRYIDDLAAEVGEPSVEDEEWAAGVVAGITRHSMSRRAG